MNTDKKCPLCSSKLKREGKYWVCICGFYQLIRPPKRFSLRTAHDIHKYNKEME